MQVTGSKKLVDIGKFGDYFVDQKKLVRNMKKIEK